MHLVLNRMSCFKRSFLSLFCQLLVILPFEDIAFSLQVNIKVLCFQRIYSVQCVCVECYAPGQKKLSIQVWDQ